MIHLEVHIPSQKMVVYNNKLLCGEYSVSTAKNGVGEVKNSEQTPRGLHVIRAKIGANQPVNTVFVGRRPTGEIFTPALREAAPDRDWILTRILWLCGLEPGKNRLGNVDTMQRYVYIHGAPDDIEMGTPGSRGCIRMRNSDLVELFDNVTAGTKLLILGE